MLLRFTGEVLILLAISSVITAVVAGVLHTLVGQVQASKHGGSWHIGQTLNLFRSQIAGVFLAFFSIGIGLLTMVWFMDFHRPRAAFVIVPLIIVGVGASIALMLRPVTVEGMRS